MKLNLNASIIERDRRIKIFGKRVFFNVCLDIKGMKFMEQKAFDLALNELNDEYSKLIFARILESRKVSFHVLEDELTKIAEDYNFELPKPPEVLVREGVKDLKSRHWIGELPSANNKLNLYYLTAEGLMATRGLY